ncbi:MAG TPA: hypothetical protein VFR21_26705 [Bradyrhizobium sp.]|jgi:ABC-type multidrug transport system ATPase subunit|nr:hypothetical protein [Bradyrhizobium sp.]
MPAPAWRKLVKYVAAESGWWADRAIEHYPAAALSAVTARADHLGLRADVLDAPVQQLSTGAKQRLSLVRALLLNPPVPLLE